MASKYFVLLMEMHKIMKANGRPKQLMTIDEVANYTGWSKSHVYKLTSQRLIPHYKPLNKSIFFKRSEIDKWIFQHPVATTDKLFETFTKADSYKDILMRKSTPKRNPLN